MLIECTVDELPELMKENPTALAPSKHLFSDFKAGRVDWKCLRIFNYDSK
jgi:hypothetical protein